MFDERTVGLFLQGTVDTIYVTLASTLFAYVFGIVMGVALVITRKDGIRPNALVYSVLDVFVNLTRSFPFLILLIAVIPLTRLIVGTSIGNNATIVPLVISAAPFVARLIESSLLEVDPGVVEAAQSMGASNLQIVWKVYLPEAVPSLILGASISIITLLGYTAIAGAVGAGGLGDLAVRYGYQRRVTSMMVVTVIFIIILVQVIQSVFSWLSTKLDKRLR